MKPQRDNPIELDKRQIGYLLLEFLASIDHSFKEESRGLSVELIERSKEQIVDIFDNSYEANRYSEFDKYYLVKVRIHEKLCDDAKFVHEFDLTREQRKKLDQKYEVVNFQTKLGCSKVYCSI